MYCFLYKLLDYTGAGVNVYILDTGLLLSHDEFDKDRAHCAQDFLATETPGFFTNLFPNRNPQCTDENGHGTHVAGTIGGKTYGIAKAVHLYSLKVCYGTGSCPR